jgi:hypothetical protein
MITTNRGRKTARTWLSLLMLAALMAAYAPVAGAQQNGASTSQERILRVYNPSFLNTDNAMALAFQACGDDERCVVESMGSQGLLLKAIPQVHAEYEKLLSERDMPPATQEFRVILLRADQSGNMPEVSADAGAALEDLRGMLPYTGFEMIDSGWIRTSGAGSTTLGEAGSFGVQLFFEGDPRQDGTLLMQFELAHSQVFWENLGGENGAIPRAHLTDPKSVLSSQFGINVGETVVVGTSRTN